MLQVKQPDAAVRTVETSVVFIFSLCFQHRRLFLRLLGSPPWNATRSVFQQRCYSLCVRKHVTSEMWRKCFEKALQSVHSRTATVRLRPKRGCTSSPGSNGALCHGTRAPTSHGICGMQMKFRAVDSRQGRSGFLTRSLEYKGIFRKCEKRSDAWWKCLFQTRLEPQRPLVAIVRVG